jgi:hypothetical protein
VNTAIMKRFSIAFSLAAASVAFAQYKMDMAAGAPPEVAPAFASLLQKQGIKVTGANGSVWAEVWLRSSAPSGPKSTEEGVSLPTIPHGAFLGVIQFPANGADRRGQMIKPGVYTLRYSLHPVNGDHLGVAPQRDFAVLVPAAEDKDPNANLGYDALMALSKKASGTPHPAVLSLSTSSAAGATPTLAKEGDHDWVINAKLGELPVALIVVGKAEG